MKRERLFNDQWQFSRMPLHTSYEEMKNRQEDFSVVGIPHDWLIYDTEHLYEDGTGWYRRILEWECKDDELVFLRFEGVYMDCHVWINPEEHPEPVKEWKYGYSTFEVEISHFLKNGRNEIWVSVDYQAPNSRWYSGAGIYRNVWLKTMPKTHLISDGIYFHAEKAEDGYWNVDVSAEVEGESADVTFVLENSLTGKSSILGTVSADHVENIALHTKIQSPEIWDLENPNCYHLRTILKEKNVILQEEVQMVGFRTIVFDPKQGFLLNGRKVKFFGVCEHHDLGCLGSAFHPQAMRRKMEILKEMGCNAIRLSHNMPAPEVMELADEMGILIVSEAFDMWESTKTPYDYGRFFTEWYEKDVASWVRRDRNHPSVILWSIGNEIYDTHISERGQMWTRILLEETKKHDPLGNALPTIGSNYMPWENAQKCADIIKIAGYNYGAAYYKAHHEAHPDWVIYGSETSSVVQSRGIYHFPYEKSVLADVDEQCSSIGNSTTSWGAKSAEACIAADRDHPYSAGQFLWSGFDYIGEPTPYHTRNSYFGQIDTAGFPKDSFYIYKAAWHESEKKPVLHLFPHWDFNDGQKIDVRAYTNADSVEMFLNGKSQGKQKLNHKQGEKMSGSWKVPYEKGEIRAIAYDRNGKILAEDARHSFGEAAELDVKLSAEELHADGQELLFLEISMKDKDGYSVENANNRVKIEVHGAGQLIGTDNGDSTEKDGYKTDSKRLFSGKLLAVLKAGTVPGILEICVSSPEIPAKRIRLNVVEADVREGISENAYCFQTEKNKKFSETVISEEKTDIPVRNIYLSSSNGTHLGPQIPDTIVTASICPETASDQELFWCIVDDAGIPSFLADVEANGCTAKITVKSDGNFRLRCMSKCGTDKIRIISQLEFSVEGLGTACLDPYGFISGGLYAYSRGEIGNGNEHGVATARNGESQVGFQNIDFGPYGSDEICLPIFALTGDPYEIQIYEGMPGEEDSELIGDVIYQKPSIWNTYQEETYRLTKRLKGITSLCFVLKAKIHLKGFSFVKKNRAFERLFAGECDQVYGDTFRKDGEWLKGIGNNVTLVYENLDFGENGISGITICGKTSLEKNTIILSVKKNGEEQRRILEYEQGEGRQTFAIERLEGTCEIQFIFLPGSNFDFHWFQFE